MGTPRSEIVPGRCNAPERVSELTAALPSCLPDCGTAVGACDSFLPALGTAGWCWELPIGVRLRGFGGKWVRNLVISGCGTCRTPELFRCQLQRCGVAPDCRTSLGAPGALQASWWATNWLWGLPSVPRLRGFGGKSVRNLVISSGGTCRTPELFRC